MKKLFLLMLIVTGSQIKPSFVSKMRLASYKVADACRDQLFKLQWSAVKTAVHANSPKTTQWLMEKIMPNEKFFIGCLKPRIGENKSRGMFLETEKGNEIICSDINIKTMRFEPKDMDKLFTRYHEA